MSERFWRTPNRVYSWTVLGAILALLGLVYIICSGRFDEVFFHRLDTPGFRDVKKAII